MLAFLRSSSPDPKTSADCSGCGLCLLVCPVWRRTRDIELTPHGRSKALQNGARPADIATSIQSCTLCGACEPVCPERIDLTDRVLDLRRTLGPPAGFPTDAGQRRVALQPSSSAPLLLPDRALTANPDALKRTAGLLGGMVTADDDGSDIALALEAGADISSQRLERFLAPLRRGAKLIVADGLLLRHVARWLPGVPLVSLGEALSSVPEVRDSLRATDLYVIESRAYHADYQRLVKYYDGLRRAKACAFNLDLQRIAIPASAPNLLQRLGLESRNDDEQAHWILHGRRISRIVVENLEDRAVFENVSDVPVAYLADVMEAVAC